MVNLIYQTLLTMCPVFGGHLIYCAGCAELMAEAKIYLVGFRKGIPTEWIITRAEHVLDRRGYRTNIEATYSDDEEKGNE